MQRRIVVALFASLAVVVLGPAGLAAAGGGGHSTCDGFTRGQTLAMRDACFEGATHFVEPGATVVVKNEGQVAHDIVAVDGSFTSPRLAPGETFELAVDRASIVPFYCTLHGDTSGARMAGVLVVGEPDQASRAALASATDAADALAAARPDQRDVVAVVRSSDHAAVVILAGIAVLLAGAALSVVALAGVRSRRRQGATGA